MSKLKINEIFASLQGESTYSGLPFVFIRFSGCDLRCSYCDTKYAYLAGKYFTVPEILLRVKKFGLKNVLITGGEPLLQEGVAELTRALLDLGFTTLIETNGAHSLGGLPREARYIVDMKTPSSGMSHRMHPAVPDEIGMKDELKFVLGNRKDYDFAKKMVLEKHLLKKTNVLFSCVYGKLKPATLAAWILRDHLEVRLQLQMHKFIWAPEKRRVWVL